MENGINATEEVKTGELTVQNYEIVGFDESIIPVNRVAELKEKFVPMLQSFETHNANRDSILKEFEQYKDSGEAAPKSLIDKAFRHRNDIAKIRITTEKARKSCNEDLNKAKSGNDALAKYIKDNVSVDEAEMKEIEIHNEKIETERLKVIQSERSKTASKQGFDEEMDFSSMAQTIFDSFIAGLKVKKEEAEEATRKSDLRISRQTECLNLSEFIPCYDAIDLGELNNGAYEDVLNTAKRSKKDTEDKERIEREKAEEEQKRIKLENEKLLKEKEESEARSKVEKLKQSARAKDLQQYIVFIRDYDSLISMDDEDYQKEFNEIKKGAEDHWESERKEVLKVQAEKDAREAREADEKKRQDEAQRIAKEQREKAERETREAKEAEELKTREAEEAKKSEEAAKLKLKEAEERHAAELKALADSSAEIDSEQIDRAKSEGKAVYVKVIRVEVDSKEPGIFIVKE